MSPMETLATQALAYELVGIATDLLNIARQSGAHDRPALGEFIRRADIRCVELSEMLQKYHKVAHNVKAAEAEPPPRPIKAGLRVKLDVYGNPVDHDGRPLTVQEMCDRGIISPEEAEARRSEPSIGNTERKP